MTKQKKIIIGILGALALAILALVIYSLALPYYQSWKMGQNYREFEKSMYDYWKKDIYGGKTPQETYEMYINALKNGDLEKASKYYWWEKQVPQEKKLAQLKQDNKLEEYIAGLPKWTEMSEEEHWDKDVKRYGWKWVRKESKIFIDPIDGEKIILPPGEGESEITFQLNKHANIWKIY